MNHSPVTLLPITSFHNTKNHSKSSKRKRAEIFELDYQMRKKHVCGVCHQGFEEIKEYEEHTNSEEHTYHIQRKIATLVPGLGFCAACACQIQTEKGWLSHIQTDKHLRSVESLNALGCEGQYDEPLGCTEPGELGMPVKPSELDIKLASSHGYGYGGKMSTGIPIIGLNHVTSKVINKFDDVKYTCGTCSEDFTFELRGNHLSSDDHLFKYLAMHYPAWYEDSMKIPAEFVMQIKFRLMFYANEIEKIEKDSESPAASFLRKKFLSEATQRRVHNVGKSKEERDYSCLGHADKPGNGNKGKHTAKTIVFVKEGENNIPKYTMTEDCSIKKHIRLPYEPSKNTGQSSKRAKTSDTPGSTEQLQASAIEDSTRIKLVQGQPLANKPNDEVLESSETIFSGINLGKSTTDGSECNKSNDIVNAPVKSNWSSKPHVEPRSPTHGNRAETRRGVRERGSSEFGDWKCTPRGAGGIGPHRGASRRGPHRGACERSPHRGAGGRGPHRGAGGRGPHRGAGGRGPHRGAGGRGLLRGAGGSGLQRSPRFDATDQGYSEGYDDQFPSSYPHQGYNPGCGDVGQFEDAYHGIHGSGHPNLRHATPFPGRGRGFGHSTTLSRFPQRPGFSNPDHPAHCLPMGYKGGPWRGHTVPH